MEVGWFDACGGVDALREQVGGRGEVEGLVAEGVDYGVEGGGAELFSEMLWQILMLGVVDDLSHQHHHLVYLM